MNKSRYRSIFITLLVACSLLAACSPAPDPSPTVTDAPIILPTAHKRLETLDLPTKTVTLTPSLTQALTATWTVTPGPTNSVTPTAQFDKAQVISVTNPPGGFQVAMRVPGITAALDIILEARKFSCKLEPAARETLFCQGLTGPPIDRPISLVFIDPKTGAEVYKGTTYIITAAVPTATPVGFGSCPDRGKDIFCEVECRTYGGEPCLVATCSDACGVYYSLHNCPQDVPNDGMCSSEVEQEMRQKYGIP